MPALKEADGARIVCVSSRGHRWGGVIFDDVNFEHTEYKPMRAYAQSKTANALFAVKLDKLVKKDGIRAFAVHPGPIPSTDLLTESNAGIASPFKVKSLRLMAKIMRGAHLTGFANVIRRPKDSHDLYKTVQQGAATTVWAATSGDLNNLGGLYLEDCNVAEIVRDDPKISYGVRPFAIDEENADKLWTLSENMLGTNFIKLLV